MTDGPLEFEGDPGPEGPQEGPPQRRRKRGENRRNLHVLPPIEWMDRLQMTAQGGYRTNLFNACVALRHSPELKGCVGLDEFGLRAVVLKPLPWSRDIGRPWSDHDDLRFAEWLQAAGPNVALKVAQQAVESVAAEHKFHPVRDWLTGLVWDRKPRVGKWLSYYLGAELTPYTQAVGKAWLISAVARIFRPGCKADHMLIFEGEQGLLKSTMLKSLVPDEGWFTDEVSDFGSKDAALDLASKWLVEIAELDNMNRSEVSRTKAFVSRAVDRYRPPYGRRSGDFPRQCVFAGTVNKAEYFKDETGNRRYWPVRVGETIDLEALKADRDQLWAEAVHLYREGEPWWLADRKLEAMARVEQHERLERDAWHEPIEKWLSTKRGKVTIEEILRDLLRVELGRQDEKSAKRVGRVLRSLGWTKDRRRTDGDRQYGFWPPSPVDPSCGDEDEGQDDP